MCFVSLNFQERLKPAKSSASIRNHPSQLFSQTPRTFHSSRAFPLAGPALSHRRGGRRARLIHDLRHQVHSLSVGRHFGDPVDTEGAALGAATSYASTTIVAIDTDLLGLTRAWLPRLSAVRLLLLLPLLSGQILIAEILPVCLALLTRMLPIGI
ncbi:hypothetical protein [Stenotrophomonas maltophilia]|uniref:hypothetical protein n=1 Tax=Stenotrophomonas maltophilia TaxID=40324 RepID=UPI001F536CBD|nr:hypothetical protein [Stenotrophomonas maltophilia]MCI1150065.1 hypothetical protein [Stenotrophomonas maltophilia]